MAWTTPSTQPTGTLITSTMYATHLVNNLKFLHGPPTVQVSRAAALSHTVNASWEEVAFDTEGWDSNTMWSSTANTKVFCRTAGKYYVCASGSLAASTGGTQRGIGVRLNSTSGNPEFAHLHNHDWISAQENTSVSQLMSLTTGQYVQLVMYQDSGGSLAFSTVAAYRCKLSMVWVSS